MKKINQVGRRLALIIFILLAAFGVGIIGQILPFKPRDPEVPFKIEMVDKENEKEDEVDVLQEIKR